MIRVIAFDLDDTLWHVDPVIRRAERELALWLQGQVPDLIYDHNTMRRHRDEVLLLDPTLGYRLTALRQRIIEVALVSLALPEAQATTLAEAAMEVFLEARNQVEFFEGALDTIQAMSEHYQLGALTNGNADIKRLGLADHFSFAFSAEQVGAPKPALDLFEAALAHTGCEPGEMVYVGDDPVKDIDPANRVGLHTVWLQNTVRPGPGETSPDHIIEDIRHLPAVLRSLDRR